MSRLIKESVRLTVKKQAQSKIRRFLFVFLAHATIPSYVLAHQGDIFLSKDDLTRVAVALHAVHNQLKVSQPALCSGPESELLNEIKSALTAANKALSAHDALVCSKIATLDVSLSRHDDLFDSKFDVIEEAFIGEAGLLGMLDQELSLHDVLICSKLMAIERTVRDALIATEVSYNVSISIIDFLTDALVKSDIQNGLSLLQDLLKTLLDIGAGI